MNGNKTVNYFEVIRSFNNGISYTPEEKKKGNCSHCNGTGIGLGWDLNNRAIEIPNSCKVCNGSGHTNK